MNLRKFCYMCKYYEPHLLVHTVGKCKKKNENVSFRDICEEFDGKR